jgi:hypothetical protein
VIVLGVIGVVACIVGLVYTFVWLSRPEKF